MRRMYQMKRVVLLAIAIWACAVSGFQVQVWCRAPHGHSAIEPLLGSCCTGIASGCASEEMADGITGARGSGAFSLADECGAEGDCTDITIRFFMGIHTGKTSLSKVGNCFFADCLPAVIAEQLSSLEKAVLGFPHPISPSPHRITVLRI